MSTTKISEPITLEKLMPLIQRLSQDEREQLRQLLERDSTTGRKKRGNVILHSRDAGAGMPDEEALSEFNAILAEIRSRKSEDPKE
ncbi:MAG: hypothetical protein OXN17_08970 [Candidatus Poribacteria bacterium]|nr:hypothetical protein [Candidatus Poribacteria bacterium]MDE0505572.1 hypothetical protein [Candidatus Poribacteria bacterium]